VSNKPVNTLHKETYHEVFVPFPDVYELGGPEAFRHLERRQKRLSKNSNNSVNRTITDLNNGSDRNLIVIPFSFINTLSEMENQQYSMSAADALKYVKNCREGKSIKSSTEGFSLYNVSQGLDLLVIDTPEFCNPNFKMSELDKYLKNYANFNALKIITNDSKNHIKYSGMGLKVEDPEFLQVNEDIVHEGIIMGNEELLEKLLSSESSAISLDSAESILDRELYRNQFIRFRSSAGRDLFARVTGEFEWNKAHTRILDVKDPVLKLLHKQEYDKKLRIGRVSDNSILGITPRDMEQYIALQYGLINDEVSVFCLCGKAGSGKTLLTYAAAIDSVLIYEPLTSEKREVPKDKGLFRQITLLKPPEILGGSRRDPGALPGSLLDKLTPHLRPYSDAHHETTMKGFLFDEMFRHPVYTNRYGPPRTKDVSEKRISGLGGMAKLPHVEVIDLVYSGFIGGASIRDTYIVLDEAQDFTPYEMKTIVERMAEGSKLIICGDPAQTRNPKCNVKMNGLTFAIKNYLPKHYSGLVYLNRNYRHQASEDADSMSAYNR
jgi:predicted ribonuclease YlaK